MVYRTSVIYVHVMAIIAFVLMILVTCSIPLTRSLYFLYSSEARGVRFGMWGWCLDEDGTCSAIQLGYTWEPQIPNPITKALVLYPITAVSIILTMLSLIPVAYTRNARTDRIFVTFAWISFTFSAIALFFMIGMWSIAKSRFEKQGFTASYGPLPWLSLVATLLLLAVSLSPIIIGPLPKVVTQKSRWSQVADLELEAQRHGHVKNIDNKSRCT